MSDMFLEISFRAHTLRIKRLIQRISLCKDLNLLPIGALCLLKRTLLQSWMREDIEDSFIDSSLANQFPSTVEGKTVSRFMLSRTCKFLRR